MNYWSQSTDNVYVAAHRGLSAKYPENTRLAFEKALACEGLDQIETDIRITKDGELVIIHDETVDRTSFATGLVREKTYAELLEIDFGEKFGPEFKGQKIMTFREFMEMVKPYETLTLDLELKEYPVEGRDAMAYSVADRVIEMVEEYGFGDRIVLNTFNIQLCEYIRGKYGDKYRQHIYFPISYMGKLFTEDPMNYAYCCCMFRTYFSPFNISEKQDFDRVKSYGVDTWAGAGVKNEETLDMALGRGATLITCNNCDDILDLLRKKGKHQ